MSKLKLGTLMMAAIVTASLANAGSTKVAPAPQNSKAFQFAAKGAFASLQARRASPEADEFRRILAANFKATQRFEVVVYPKFLAIPETQKANRTSIQLGEPGKFKFRIDRQGHCALADELVSAAERETCVQVEIKPLRTTTSGSQYVRVFMTPELRVYGLSYHEYDPATDAVRKQRKKLKWDSDEPLSSELLSLSQDIVPLDLPMYANDRLKFKSEKLAFDRGDRAGQSCDAFKFSYTNAYGSRVKTAWCKSDPWPSVVETNRYIAVLNQIEN